MPKETRLDGLIRKRIGKYESRPHAELEADPVAFSRLASLRDPVTGLEAPYEPDPWQAAALGFKGRLILNCARQSGKSTTAAILAVHRAYFRPGSLVLLISPSERQSQELLRKVLEVIRTVPRMPTLREENKSSVEFPNGSRIVSLPSSEATIRGFSGVSLIIEDEAGDVEDALHVAVRPMLAVSRGDMLVMGTPKGKRGHFFETWQLPETEWAHITVTAAECSRVDPAWLAREKAEMFSRGLGELFRQEYEGAFIEGAAGRVYSGFDADKNLIEALPKASVENPWQYLLGLDFGIVDPNAATVLAWRRHDQTVYVVTSYQFTAGVNAVADEVGNLMKLYKFSRVIGDTGGMGKAFQDELWRRKHPCEAADKPNKNGYIALLNGDLAKGHVKIVRPACPTLIDEWRQIVWDGAGKKENEAFPNHCADSCLYAWRACYAYAEGPAPDKPKTEIEYWEKLDREDYERTIAKNQIKRDPWEEQADTFFGDN